MKLLNYFLKRYIKQLNQKIVLEILLSILFCLLVGFFVFNRYKLIARSNEVLPKKVSLINKVKDQLLEASPSAKLKVVIVDSQSGKESVLNFKTSKFIYSSALESQMFQIVNNERMKNGLNALKYDFNLEAVARDHSADMLIHGYFSHISFSGKNVAQRLTFFGINYALAGENIAFAPSLISANEGLMDSPEHRDNILNPQFHRLGIGIADAGSLGLMITQVFTN